MLPTKYPSFTVLSLFPFCSVLRLSSWKFHVRLVNPFAFPKTICSCHPAIPWTEEIAIQACKTRQKMKNGSLFIDVLYSLFHVWFYKARSRFFSLISRSFHIQSSTFSHLWYKQKKHKCKLPIPYKYQEARIIRKMRPEPSDDVGGVLSLLKTWAPVPGCQETKSENKMLHIWTLLITDLLKTCY